MLGIKPHRVLAEWYRVLRPGGILHLAVPDFEAPVRLYQETRKLSYVLGVHCGKVAIAIDQNEDTLYHNTTYDEKSLSVFLQECSFVGPQKMGLA